MQKKYSGLLVAIIGLWSFGRQAVVAGSPTHPAMRPLPSAAPADRPLPEGPAYYVDAQRGDDTNPGNATEPWRSVQYGVDQLAPGDTLLLRDGIYYEAVTFSNVQGTAERPVTIAGYPGELAIIDAGHREFLDDPGSAWEPCPDGVAGLYRSTAVYPDLAGETATMRGLRFIVGHFADTMNPLQVYKWKTDLETDFPYLRGIQSQSTPLYMGPGFWVDQETGRVYVRLAHMSDEVWGELAYRGPTDPRQVPMVIGGVESPLYILRSSHIQVRDIVLRGSRNRVINLRYSSDLVFDGVSVHAGGVTTLQIINTPRVTMRNCVVRGASTPWSSRITHKYRGGYPSLFVAVNLSDEDAPNADFEFVDSEFTDGYGGFRGFGNIQGVRFQRNLVDNFCYITMDLTTGRPHGHALDISQNLFRRCFTVFFANNDEGRNETLAYIYRNVIDLREPLLTTPTEKETQKPGLLWGHAWHQTRDYRNLPVVKPMRLFYNTFLYPEAAWRNAYGGLSRGIDGGGSLAMYNNIFVYLRGNPGIDNLAVPADGNLHWAYVPKADWDVQTELDRRMIDIALDGTDGEQTKAQRHWPFGDRIADPRFVQLDVAGTAPLDLRLRSDSPARDAAVAVPGDWNDPLAPSDGIAPDIGAIPASLRVPWRIGPHGRYDVFGNR